MNKFITPLFLCVNIYFVSCTNNESINNKSLNPGSIYFDYQVWGDEGSNEVTIKLQYRYRNAEGITILPEHTGKVEFLEENSDIDVLGSGLIYTDLNTTCTAAGTKLCICYHA